MKLSAEHFAELQASFGGNSDVPRSSERRRASRLELAARAKVTPVIALTRGEPLMLPVLDFSARGICLSCERQLQPGDQFVIELPRKSGGRAELLCTVVNCRADSGPAAGFRIGAEFTCALPVPLRDPDTNEINTKSERIRASVFE